MPLPCHFTSAAARRVARGPPSLGLCTRGAGSPSLGPAPPPPPLANPGSRRSSAYKERATAIKIDFWAVGTPRDQVKNEPTPHLEGVEVGKPQIRWPPRAEGLPTASPSAVRHVKGQPPTFIILNIELPEGGGGNQRRTRHGNTRPLLEFARTGLLVFTPNVA